MSIEQSTDYRWLRNSKYQRKYRDKLRDTGRCVRCGGERDTANLTCSPCIDQVRGIGKWKVPGIK